MKKTVLVGKIKGSLKSEDKVVVRSDLVQFSEYYMNNEEHKEVFVDEMKVLEEQIVTIDIAHESGYTLKESEMEFWWTDEMFVGRVLTSEEQVRQYLIPGCIISSVSGAQFIVVNSNECIKITKGVLSGTLINLKNLMLLECFSITYGDEVLIQMINVKDTTHKQHVNWSEVCVDTPVFVKRKIEQPWQKRHFAKYDYSKGGVYCFDDGKTSFTETETTYWQYAKLTK